MVSLPPPSVFPLSFVLTRRLLYLLAAEDNLNIALKDITVTAADGKQSHLENVYIRGNMIRFVIVPDMLQQAPMFKRIGPNAMKGRGIGSARGRATILRGKCWSLRSIRGVRRCANEFDCFGLGGADKQRRRGGEEEVQRAILHLLLGRGLLFEGEAASTPSKIRSRANHRFALYF